MKIGIITIQKCNNYGADLQAYALQRKLQLIGYDVENIDYLFYKHPGFEKTKNSRPIFKLSIANRLKEAVFPWLQRLIGRDFRDRHAAFDKFFKQNVSVSRTYSSIDSLYANPPDYDVYITGSDQVWNPRMGANIRPYFLDFVSEGKRCIAYASSIGVPSVAPKVYDTYRRLLCRYSAIGVRELSAERIIGGMGLGVPVATVVDPTLLLTRDEWRSVAIQPEGLPPKSFVVEYNLDGNKQTHELSIRLAGELSANLINVTSSQYGPSEFVWLMANAKAAVVCSFHGTVFSVLNNIPFYSVYSESADRNGGRIASFAKSLGLDDRMVPYSKIPSLKLDIDVDFSHANSLLSEMRSKSLSFLINSIENRFPHKQDLSMPRSYAVWCDDVEIRRQSSSGGAFYLFAKQIIERGGVVFGAVFDADFRHVRHKAARSLEELMPLMKSKYVQSDFKEALNETFTLASSGQEVMFVGTPCQIAAVNAKCRSWLGNIITVDVVCFGAPAADVFASYIDELEKFSDDKVVGYEFRNKRWGWNFSKVHIAFKSGKEIWRIRERDPYLSGYARKVFMREACYSCQFAQMNRISDITIADCWRVAASHPEYDDNKGTSLVLVNTEKGAGLFDHVRSAGGCQIRAYDIQLARLRNAPLMAPAVKSCYYGDFKKMFAATGSFNAAAKSYFTFSSQIKGTIRYFVKLCGWPILKYRQ